MLLIYPAGVSNGYIKFEKNIQNFEIPEKFICILQLSTLQLSTPVP